MRVRRSALLTLIASSLGVAALCHAAEVGMDHAGNAVYLNDWQNGDDNNPSDGLLPWSSIGNAVGNGFGGGYISRNNGTVGLGSSPDNAAFGVFGNGGGVGQAVRSFDSNLLPGQSFSVRADWGTVNNGGTVGISLRSAGGANRTEYYLIGGNSVFTLDDSTARSGVVSSTGAPLTLAFTLDDAVGNYTLRVTPDGGSTTVLSGLLEGGNDVGQFRVFNANGGGDFFFNNLSIAAVPVPEPLATLGGGALLGLVALRRRK